MGERFERLRDAIREKAGRASLVEVYGTGELLLTGCVSLLDFDDCKVIVNTVNGLVTVFGEGLRIVAFRADLLSVSGCIHSVEFGGRICS